jgi:hypothetical protein
MSVPARKLVWEIRPDGFAELCIYRGAARYATTGIKRRVTKGFGFITWGFKRKLQLEQRFGATYWGDVETTAPKSPH